MNPPPTLREKLLGEGSILVAGAHSALSARLVEEAGFDAVWASGFEISAARGVPDANVLTMAEQLDVARQMADAVRLPVIADCDSGFGNVINAIRTAEEYEKAGIAAICLEDNVFPKRCSLYDGARRELAAIEEHTGKIQACLAARQSNEFLIIARTEAFIAGWGVEEAVKRARAYADAGADLLLVHSKETTQHELEMFSRRWDRKTPLVAVPTTYKEATAAQLAALGFRVLIFANHALRASVKAMRETLAVLRREQYAAAVDDRVVSVEEVCRLVGVPQMKSDEEAYSPAVPENVRAVILAAGYDDRLIPLTADRPKCMLDLKGRTILERQVEALNACGIRDISVVRGYKKERIDLPGLRYFDNDNYSTTGEAVSLYSASEALKGRMLVLYGDVLFEREVLEKLLRSPAPMSVVVDRTAIDGGTGGPSDRVRDLVVLDDPDFRTAKYMTLGAAPRVSRIGQEIAPERADGEFIGLAMFDADATRELASLGRLLAQSPGQRFGEAVEARRASLTDLIQYLIDRGTEVASVDIRGGWMDVDSFEDYRRVWDRLSR